MSNAESQNSQALYNQVCSQHNGISDFRAKLLALLPIASGAGIFLLFPKDGTPPNSPHLIFLGAFGIAITTGLLFYELRGIQKCIALIRAGIELEQTLSTARGAFNAKPLSIWGVSAEKAALIIYPAVIGAWAYIITLGLPAELWGDWINRHVHTLASIRVTIALSVAGFWAFMGAKVLTLGAKELELRGAKALETVRTLNRQSFLAEELQDCAMLEPILHDEFWIIRSGGQKQNKQEMLNALGGGRREIRNELVQLCGTDAAVALTLVGYYKDDSYVGDFWNMKVFVRTGSGWRCKMWQVVRIAQSP